MATNDPRLNAVAEREYRTNSGEKARSAPATSAPIRPTYGLANHSNPTRATPASAGRSRASSSVSPKTRNRYEVAASARSPRHVCGTSPPATRVASKARCPSSTVRGGDAMCTSRSAPDAVTRPAQNRASTLTVSPRATSALGASACTTVAAAVLLMSRPGASCTLSCTLSV